MTGVAALGAAPDITRRCKMYQGSVDRRGVTKGLLTGVVFRDYQLPRDSKRRSGGACTKGPSAGVVYQGPVDRRGILGLPGAQGCW